MTFPKIYLSYFSQLLLTSSFFNKGNSCKTEYLWIVNTCESEYLWKWILVQWSTWFIFWNIFSYCKIIISFLELFPATCFLCILQTQLVFWYLFIFEFVFLNVCKSWCMTTLYYIHPHFPIHENNKNSRKIKLPIGSVKYT